MMSARETVEQFVEFRAVVFISYVAKLVVYHIIYKLFGIAHEK